MDEKNKKEYHWESTRGAGVILASGDREAFNKITATVPLSQLKCLYHQSMFGPEYVWNLP